MLLTALFAMMVFAATRSFIQCEDCEFRASATDLGLCLGAWLAVWSCGGFYSYFDSARRGPKGWFERQFGKREDAAADDRAANARGGEHGL